MIDTSACCSPHDFVPLRWRDKHTDSGRCRACLVPKQFHPVMGWMPSRSLHDKARYTVVEIIDALRGVDS